MGPMDFKMNNATPILSVGLIGRTEFEKIPSSVFILTYRKL